MSIIESAYQEKSNEKLKQVSMESTFRIISVQRKVYKVFLYPAKP